MATLQAASSAAAAAIKQTIVGSHMMKIDGFSETEDLGVGKSIRSSTFNVGGHCWYIECYPCGYVEESADWVTLFLCLSVHEEQVEAACCFFTQVVDGNDGDLEDYHLDDHKHTYSAETSWRRGSDVIERETLESLLRDDDCFRIRCDVYIVKEFPAVPPPDLHRPLSDLLASGMPGVLTFQLGGELFTVHRGQQVQAPSAHVAASPTSTATISTENVAGSHVLTIEGYSNMKKLFGCAGSFLTECFHVGGQRWQMELYPNGYEKITDVKCLSVFINHCEDEAVKVRVELTLLTLAREIISSTQFCYAFTRTNYSCCCYNMEPDSSLLLGDSFHVKCDIAVIKDITVVRPPELHRHFGDLVLASQVGTDVTFEVGGELFSAHKLVLATRSTAFMAQFFGPAGKGGSSTTVTRLVIDDMEPRVFRALLHFIYTDDVLEVHEEDKIVVAQGLLVAADRYAMERLKMICADMLCNYVNDARTAVDALALADKHGCRRLKEACLKILKGHFANAAP